MATAVAPPVTALEPVMGLEVHCQLRTASKAFCACPTRFGDAPNTNTCPVCLGLPGALPAFNARAVELGLRLALATGCRVRPRSLFARKNYFYPDLPKGYQISQYDEPLAEEGLIDVELPDGAAKPIRLKRIHLEEDAGKSLHDVSATTTFVDFNRSGVPLVEIVTEPDFRTTGEVHAYLTSLRQLVRWLGVSDGNMEQGSLRCDVNVSVRPKGVTELGTKVELKNLNSFRSVVRAIEHELERQGAIVARGGHVDHGTRLWDERDEVTRPMRQKELAHDYRYFPDPDLLPLEVTPEMLADARRELPELPRARRLRFERELGLPPYDAAVLTSTRALADYAEEVVRASGDAKQASNWILGEVLRDMRAKNQDLEADSPAFPLAPRQLADLVSEVRSGAVSLQAAKKVFATMAGTTRTAGEVLDELGLRQVSDEAALRTTCAEVIAANPTPVADYLGGNERTFGFLVGLVMKATKGKANPQVVQGLLKEQLDARSRA